MSQQTALYRFFDGHGQLLYIGISKSAIRRMLDHADEKSWWHAVTRSTIEYHPTRSDALRAGSVGIEVATARRPSPLEHPAPAAARTVASTMPCMTERLKL